uniref:Uncharacterized protein n=1 Tax=Picea glauca TaxID=3330 RepID=A0A101M0N6_PICGL|nr:hypothetical protein ABT39_MTgene4748 [Picea glauca]
MVSLAWLTLALSLVAFTMRGRIRATPGRIGCSCSQLDLAG